MEFWVIWCIGVAIMICTRTYIDKIKRETDTFNEKRIGNYGPYNARHKDVDIYWDSKKIKRRTNLFIIISIVTVGGILIAQMIGVSTHPFIGEMGIFYVPTLMLIGFPVAALVYCLLHMGLHLEYFVDPEWLQILYLSAFVVSIIAWSIPICIYNSNIEMKTDTVIESQTERKLLYFCNIPVQEVSGRFSGSSILGSGGVSGKITTSDNLPYWYLNENGDGSYDDALAAESNIIFIEDNQSPYVEITVYSTKTITENNNNGSKKTKIEETKTEYNFYLPEKIMQYNLN